VLGIDPGFDENVRAILRQSYPKYRLLIVPDDSADPAADRLRTIAAESPRVPVSVVVAEPSNLQGKVNAVRSGLLHLTPTDEVVAFEDSVIEPGPLGFRHSFQPPPNSLSGWRTGSA